LRLDPDKVHDSIRPAITKLSRQIIKEVMLAQAPLMWKLLPKAEKEKVYANTEKQIPAILHELMDDVKHEISSILDLKALAVSVFMDDRALINKIFLEVGAKEFKFIEKSGLYFGFVFGLIQMAIFFFYSPWWMLPITGVAVGYGTNFFALKMIFRPLKEFNFLGLKIQGLFFKRQKEVSASYSAIVTKEILTTERMFDFIFRGPDTTRITEIIAKHISRMVNNTADEYSGIIKKLRLEKRMQIIKNIASYRFAEELQIALTLSFDYAENALDLCNTMTSKMEALPLREFEGFLHPVFEEDELKLILVGAFLGGLAGLAQYFVFF